MRHGRTRAGCHGERRRAVLPLTLALIIAASVALIAAASAQAAQQYCNMFLNNGDQCSSGWNYWWATDVTKDPGASRLGFVNDRGTNKYETGSGTYIYTDSAELDNGGYMYAYVKKVSSGYAYHNADVCVC